MGDPIKASIETVLYIDDDEANRKLMSRVFAKRFQAKLVTCDSGDAGLKLVQSEPPDVVLLDLNIPGLSGGEVLERMRSDPALARIPVVIVSGDPSAQQIERMMNAGATAYLTKPFVLNELVATIENLLHSDQGAQA